MRTRCVLWGWLLWTGAIFAADIPHLRRIGEHLHLFVENEPFLMLAGEVGNSAATELSYLEPAWPRFKQMQMNTVLVPVYWDLLEPEEGRFDFSQVDGLIEQARAHQMRLVLLWFGTWKNSMSCYAPAWVKQDWRRFERVRLKDGRTLEILSAFCPENLRADTAAFRALMRHLRQMDEKQQTVLMVQVENEVGMLEDAREWGRAANEAFAGPVPTELMDYLAGRKETLHPALRALWAKQGFRTSGTWQQVFGKGLETDEIFTAWHYGRYVQAVAAAGKAEYPLPMFVNAALNRPNKKPGEYPSGGPLPHLMDIWKAAAKDIDFLAPDIYFPNVAFWCEQYTRTDNPLFIPEIRKGPECGVQVFYAVGKHRAIGFSPFAIDTADEKTAAALGQAYAILGGLFGELTSSKEPPAMYGVLLDKEKSADNVQLGKYRIHIRHDYTWGWSGGDSNAYSWPQAGGLVAQVGPDTFWTAGQGIILTFQSANPNENVGILWIEEGQFQNGQWVRTRRLSGDESHQGRHVRLPMGEYGVQRFRLYCYQ
ncbi:MAG TPA: DUF5597 domain-containing protein [Anaerohalosphaeraceae bacterium]|nr:DUF5597 domain-containing protein [Anaerohalosphaeraceae bacterium]HPP56924.1 DUF5597 domain-containing protein [Anaerohalosphaeraceae bacterium]